MLTERDEKIKKWMTRAIWIVPLVMGVVIISVIVVSLVLVAE